MCVVQKVIWLDVMISVFPQSSQMKYSCWDESALKAKRWQIHDFGAVLVNLNWKPDEILFPSTKTVQTFLFTNVLKAPKRSQEMFCEACVYVVLYTVLHSRYTANYKVWTQSFSTQSDISSLFLTQHPTQGHQLFSGFMQQAKKVFIHMQQ